MEAYRVSGCGISLICYDRLSVSKWMAYIVERGGVPTVNKLTQEELNAWVKEDTRPARPDLGDVPNVND
jgi:hypothetical protein